VIRVLLDVNVYVSYLLRPDGESPPVQAVEAALAGRFTVLLPASLVVELVTMATKKKLAKRITRRLIDDLVDELLPEAEQVESLTYEPDAICCDPKNNYLFAHAVLEEVDYLVSGDDDLLALRDISPVKIVLPAEFARILSELPEDDE
jgi:putative PIN family toxin of toxin-antitoxin system